MIDEVLFMQVRLFRQFRARTGLDPVSANGIWESQGIWNFIRDCYGSLHLSGDDLALDDICLKLAHQGVAL